MIPVASQPVSDLLHPRILQVYLISSLDLALVNIQLSAENVDVCAGHPVFPHLKQILCTSQLPLTPYLARGDRWKFCFKLILYLCQLLLRCSFSGSFTYFVCLFSPKVLLFLNEVLLLFELLSNFRQIWLNCDSRLINRNFCLFLANHHFAAYLAASRDAGVALVPPFHFADGYFICLFITMLTFLYRMSSFLNKLYSMWGCL